MKRSMKNSADLGGCYSQRPKAEVDPTKAKLNNCFIIDLKYFNYKTLR